MHLESPRSNWSREEIVSLFDMRFDALIEKALHVARANWPSGSLQKSQLLSIKTGGCPEDCGYCAQSAHFDTGLNASKLLALEEVVAAAKRAKANGAQRFCMGAAWRSLKDRDVPQVAAMIRSCNSNGCFDHNPGIERASEPHGDASVHQLRR